MSDGSVRLFYAFSAILLLKMKFTVLCLLLCLSISIASGYKILFLSPFNCKSHWIFLESIIKALLERNHDVTCITSIPISGPKPANYTEILVDPPLDFDAICEFSGYNLIYSCFSYFRDIILTSPCHRCNDYILGELLCCRSIAGTNRIRIADSLPDLRNTDKKGLKKFPVAGNPSPGNLFSHMPQLTLFSTQKKLPGPPGDKLPATVTQEQLFEISEESTIRSIFKLPGMRKWMVDYALSSNNVKSFIRQNDLSFDLVINEEFFQEAFSMFAHKYKASLITISTYGNSDHFDHQMGLLTPWSHVPNTVLMHHIVHIPNQSELARKYFSHLSPLPSIGDLRKNVSLILVNTHRSVLPPRPTMPGIVNIGGAHIKAPQLLPDDIQNFLDEAEHGAIYFSLGTILRSAEMPKDKLNSFIETFSKLKQRILWKFEDESVAAKLPSNVLIRKWMPQSDILAHRNLILFMAHGGMFGNFEAVARGVPLLIFPVFADQHRNAMRVANAGYGTYINFQDITNDSLFSAIQELIVNKSFTNKAKEISSIFGDNLVHPLDEATFWIEYVCRHRGAKHLKSHAVDMSIFAYLLLDVILATVFALLTMVSVIYFLLKRILRRLFTKANLNKKQN